MGFSKKHWKQTIIYCPADSKNPFKNIANEDFASQSGRRGASHKHSCSMRGVASSGFMSTQFQNVSFKTKPLVVPCEGGEPIHEHHAKELHNESLKIPEIP